MVRQFEFESRLWLYPGKAGWRFLTLPKEVAEEIDYYFAEVKRGWGSHKVKVKVGGTEWETSIFPDKASGSYVLPVKKAVRKAEGLEDDSIVMVKLRVGS